MCISLEWSMKQQERFKRWETEGLSAEEAREKLHYLTSTADPIATEMASWLYENWTLKQIDALGPGYRDLFLRALERGGIRTPDI